MRPGRTLEAQPGHEIAAAAAGERDDGSRIRRSDAIAQDSRRTIAPRKSTGLTTDAKIIDARLSAGSRKP
jgi:hypothetical protein